MRRTIPLAFLVTVLSVQARAAEQPVTVADRPDASRPWAHYVANRPPLEPSPLAKLPIGAIEPRSWLRRQLELEADGFSGRLPELSRFVVAEGNAWLSPTGEGHSPWEEVPYWLKGYGDLGYALGDRRIIDDMQKWIEAVFASQRDDGYFGPRANLGEAGAKNQGVIDLWPNMVMLNVLQSHYEYTGDERVLSLMKRYFEWQMGIPDDKFLPPFWQQQRAGDNMASVYWLYNRTGDEKLLALATKIKKNMANWFEEIASWHGVNITQCFRSPAIYWMQSKDPEHLQAAYRNYTTVMERYGQVPGGMFGADENCRPGYSGPRQAAESCSMAEYMLSHELMLKITGDLLWADRCEDVAFNSFPSSMTADLKSLRYLTAPNQTLSDRHNKSPGIQNRGAMFLFDPRSHRCCQHNIAHAWPYFAEHLWIVLIPMGCARLRLSAFPVAGAGPAAQRWHETRRAGPASASHCFEHDTVEALGDGVLPKSSGDRGIPRFTWWDHRGTTEWVAYRFEKPKTISEVEVFWFDDTGVGQCRVPKSWRVEWHDGNVWQPVRAAGDFGVALDRFNRVTFEPVTTKELRLVVDLQPKFSAGILEWRVK